MGRANGVASERNGLREPSYEGERCQYDGCEECGHEYYDDLIGELRRFVVHDLRAFSGVCNVASRAA